MDDYRKYFKTTIVPCQVIDQGLGLTYDLSRLTLQQAESLFNKGCKYLELTEEGKKKYLGNQVEKKDDPEREDFPNEAVENIPLPKNAPPAPPKKRVQKKKEDSPP